MRSESVRWLFTSVFCSYRTVCEARCETMRGTTSTYFWRVTKLGVNHKLFLPHDFRTFCRLLKTLTCFCLVVTGVVNTYSLRSRIFTSGFKLLTLHPGFIYSLNFTLKILFRLPGRMFIDKNVGLVMGVQA